MEQNLGYPHLDVYRDVTPAIDEAIEKLGFLIGCPRTYFSVQRDLKTALFRITDTRFLERIKRENNKAFLEEVAKATPYKDEILKLIDDIHVFEAENQKLLKAILQKGSIDGKELSVIFPYLYTLAMDTTAHDRIPVELVKFFGESTKEKCGGLSSDEYAIFCCLLIKIKAKGRYWFAYPGLADELVTVTESKGDIPPQNRAVFYTEAAEYYAKACQRDKAMACFKGAAAAAKDSGDGEEYAYAMQKYYRLNRAFPKSMQVKPHEEEIKKEHGKYAATVLKGITEDGLKVDPVEFTPGFAEAFQRVMWKVEAEIDKVGDLHVGYQRWSLMEEYFAQMGIKWRCPKLMNPNVMFD